MGKISRRVCRHSGKVWFLEVRNYNCSDCQRLIRPGNLYGHGLDNVCGRCYAIRVQHPSARKKVTMINFDNVINEESIAKLTNEEAEALLAILEKAGY